MDDIFENNISDDESNLSYHSNKPALQNISNSSTEVDYYNENNLEYMNTPAYPIIPCPTLEDLNSDEKFIIKRENNQISSNQGGGRFIYINEKQVISCLVNNKEDVLINQDSFVNMKDYEISKKNNLTFIREIKDSNFSKETNRQKIFKDLSLIEFDLYQKIKSAKDKINPFEEVYEGLFHRNSSIQLANIDYLFKNNLIKKDYINDYTDILCVGDDGGYVDYFSWRKRDFIIRMFCLCPVKSKFFTTKFINLENNEIATLEHIYFNKNDNIELDEIDDISSDLIKQYVEEFKAKSDGLMLYIAKKKLRFDSEFKENKLKKFFFVNVLLALSCLSPEGTFVIKIYETYTNFTISLLYILYSTFENFSIVKPYSSHKVTPSRFVVCEGFKPGKCDEYMDILFGSFDTFMSIYKSNLDIDNLLKPNFIVQDNSFKNYIFETNNDIDEKRINGILELTTAISSDSKLVYDKMGLKKKCLDLWKIPVKKYKATEEYGYKKQQQMISSRNDYNSTSTKPINDLEKARMYKDFDTYESKAGKDFLDMLSGSPKKKDLKIKSEEKYQIAIKNESIFDKPMPECLKTTKQKKAEEVKKKKEEPNDYKSNSNKEDSFTNQKRFKDDEEEIKFKTKMIKDTFKNRKDLESNKAVVADDILAELAKFKK